MNAEAEHIERVVTEMKEASQDTEEMLNKYGLRKKQKPARILKVPRNSLCLCRSGKKFKHCCMLKYDKTNFDIRKEIPFV